MFTAWFALEQNLLPHRETAAVLSWLFTLENDRAPASDQALALEMLDDRLDPNLKIFAVPYLVHAAMAGREVSGIAEDILKREMGQGAVADLVPYLSARKDLETRTKSIVPELDIEGFSTEGSFGREDYIDLGRRKAVLLVLSVLRELPPAAATAILEQENWEGFLHNALTGRYGRYAAVLAFSAADAINRPVYQREYRGLLQAQDFCTQPDLVYAYLSRYYAGYTAEEILADVLAKGRSLLTTCRNLEQFPAIDTRNIWFLQDADYMVHNPAEFVMLLWEYSALLLAVRRAIRENAAGNNDAAERLADKLCGCWTESLGSDRPDDLNPWLKRSTPIYYKGDYVRFSNPNKEYPTLFNYQNQIGGFKAFLAVPSLAMMISCLGPDVPDVLAEMSMELSDALTGRNMKSIYDGDNQFVRRKMFSRSVLALIAFSAELCDALSKGYVNEQLPAQYFRLVERKSLPLLRGEDAGLNENEKLLHSGVSLMLCVYMAYEQGSAELPWNRNRSAWYGPCPDAPENGITMAEQLCRYACNEFLRFIGTSGVYPEDYRPQDLLGRPISLIYERFPDSISDALREGAEDWLASYERGDGTKQKLTEANVLLFDEQDPDRWRNVLFSGSRSDYVGNNHKAMLALCKKVQAIARDDEEITKEDHDALLAWGEVFSRIFKKFELSRSCRFLTAETLGELLEDGFFYRMSFLEGNRFNDLAAWSENDARDLSQIAAETVVDNSGETVFYQYKIGEALLNARLDQHITAKSFILLSYFSLLLYQHKTVQALPDGPISVFHRREIAASEAGREEVLQWFLGKAVPLMAEDPDFKRCVLALLEPWRALRPGAKKQKMCITADAVLTSNNKVIHGWKYWDPDTVNAYGLNTEGTFRSIWTQYVDGCLLPMERDFNDLLADTCGTLAKEPLKLILIESDQDGVLVSARPGENYRLPADAWETGSFDRLTEEIDRIGENTAETDGLYLFVSLSSEQDLPKLRLERTDDLNIRYRELFEYGETIELTGGRDEESYTRDGFAVTVRSIGRPLSPSSEVMANAWSTEDRRRRILKVKPAKKTFRTIECPEEKAAEVLKKYLSVARGQIIEIVSAARPQKDSDNQEYTLAFTAEGMPVRVATESLALNHYGLKSNVSRCWALVAVTPENGTRPNGIVWRSADDGTLTVRVLQEDGSVTETETSAERLGISPRAVFCGLPVTHYPATGETRVAQRLRGNARTARIMVRRLWEMEERDGKADPGEEKIYIGKYYLPGSGNAKYLLQDLQRGRLAACSEDAGTPPEESCGICLSKGKVLVRHQLIKNSIAEFRADSRVFYGHVDNSCGISSVPTVCAKAEVRLKEYTAPDGTVVYDVLRYFSEPVRAGAKPAAVKNVKERTAESYFREYNEWRSSDEWMRDGCLHVMGKFLPDENGGAFLPEEPVSHLPKSIFSPSDNDPDAWTDRIPMTLFRRLPPTEPTAVYAKLSTTAEGGFLAAPEESERFSLQELQRWLCSRFPNTQYFTNAPLYYVETVREEEKRLLIFELCLGFSVAVPPECFIVQPMRQGDHSQLLFYGDALKSYRFTKNAEGSLSIVVSPDDLQLSVEHQVERDAARGMIQYMQVRYDPALDRVSPLKVSVTAQSPSAEEPQQLKRFTRCALDEETAAYVKTSLPEGGVAFLTVRRKKWDGVSLRQFFTRAPLSEMRNVTICLRGGDIAPTASGNDFTVWFTADPEFLEGETALGEDPGFRVLVTRRNFSFNESALRVYYRTGKKDAFRGDMLVKITEDGRTAGTKIGTLKENPVHTVKNVKNWLRDCGPQHVVLGTGGQENSVKVEIRPGVFCFAFPRGAAPMGTTGILFLDNNRVCVESVSADDRKFCVDGRRVDLLMMDQTVSCQIRQEGATPEEKEQNVRSAIHNIPSHFTAAGLPQIMIDAPEMALETIRYKPPRFGVIRKGTGLKVFADKPQGVLFGQLRAEELPPKQPGFAPVHHINLYKMHQTETIRMDPGQLSFLDGSIEEIWQHIRRGTWHYHDQKTSVMKKDGTTYEYEYGTDSDLPVILSPKYSLRYPAADLDLYAFPPHEPQEYGLPAGSEGIGNRFPVAAVGEDGLYVELSPGRIVEFSTKLLRLPGDGGNAKLCLNYLAAGDLVRLTSREGTPGTPRAITIDEIGTGIRGLIRRNAYLPVADRGRGRLLLGKGVFSMKYPSIKHSFSAGDVVLLDEDNRLSDRLPFPQEGDLVYVSVSEEGTLLAAGFEDCESTLSENGTPRWRDARSFIRKYLSDPEKRRALLSLTGGSIPMRVEAADEEARTLSLSYPQPDPPEMNAVFCAQTVGMLDETRVLLRTGAFLFTVNLSAELGVGAELAGDIAAALQKNDLLSQKNNVWCQFSGREFSMRMYARTGGSCTVNLLFPLEGENGSGIVCRDRETRQFRWLPLRETAYSDRADAKTVFGILNNYAKNKPLQVAVRRDGTASWISSDPVLLGNYSRLDPKQKTNAVSVIVCSDDLADHEADSDFLYLCRERPFGNLYTLRTEIAKAKGDAVYAVCCRKEPHNVELRPTDELRTRILLSPGTVNKICFSYAGGKLNRSSLIAKFPYPEDDPRAFDEGTLPENPEPTTELTALYAAAVTLRRDQIDERDERSKRLDADALRAMVAYYEQLGDEPQIPLTAAIAITALIGRKDPSLANATLRLIMRDVPRYCCEDVLLEDWLLWDTGSYGLYDLRKLLDELDLQGKEMNNKVSSERVGTLTAAQTEALNAICSTIRRRYRGVEHRDIARVAMCLQYVVNQQKADYELNRIWESCTIGKILYRQKRVPDSVDRLYEESFVNGYREWIGSRLIHIGLHRAAEFKRQLFAFLNDAGFCAE